MFDRLMDQVHVRARELPPDSYTTRLIQGGVPKMGAKITEEAAEVVDAAANSTSPDNKHLVYEACDLIYHLWVLLGSRGVTVDELRNELARREGVSGLTEKQNRTSH
jgi:phosphoribosyl-ATP pyrophosphohydrolase